LARPSSSPGSLVVTVSGPGNTLIRELSVKADTLSRCEASPCRMDKLTPGTHFIQVSAPGYEEAAARAVHIERGAESVLHVELLPARAVATEAPKAAGPAPQPEVTFNAD